MAEFYRGRIAAVLTADTAMHIRTNGFAHLSSHFHQFAYADLIQFCKRIILVDLVIIVCAEEFAGIVTAEAEGHLR